MGTDKYEQLIIGDSQNEQLMIRGKKIIAFFQSSAIQFGGVCEIQRVSTSTVNLISVEYTYERFFISFFNSSLQNHYQFTKLKNVFWKNCVYYI